MVTVRKTTTLTEQQDAWIATQISVGHYTNDSEAIRYTETPEAVYAALAQAPFQSQNCATIRQSYQRRNVEQHAIYFRQTVYGIAVIRILQQRMDQVRRS